MYAEFVRNSDQMFLSNEAIYHTIAESECGERHQLASVEARCGEPRKNELSSDFLVSLSLHMTSALASVSNLPVSNFGRFRGPL